MKTKEFVKLWRINAERMYVGYTNNDGSQVSALLNKLELDDEKLVIAKELIETLLIDTHYTFLLGLDGCANIGGIQQNYKVFDENDKLLFEPGDLEAEAYEQFQETPLSSNIDSMKWTN